MSTVEIKAAATAAVEKELTAEANTKFEIQPYTPPEMPPVKAFARINIDTNSDEGRAVIAQAINKGLTDAGFTNINIKSGDHFVSEEVKPAPIDSVLAALTARNPAFLQTKIDVHAQKYPWQVNIKPDSEYPCNGAPVTGYERSAGYGNHPGNNIVELDEKGGRHEIGYIADPHIDSVLETLNAGIKAVKK